MRLVGLVIMGSLHRYTTLSMVNWPGIVLGGRSVLQDANNALRTRQIRVQN
jgi:hypothetical protein